MVAIATLVFGTLLATTANAIPTVQSRQASQALIDFTLYTDTQCFNSFSGGIKHIGTGDLNSNRSTPCELNNFRSLRIDSVENGGNNCTVFVYNNAATCSSNGPATGSFAFDPSRSCDASNPAQLVAWKVIC